MFNKKTKKIAPPLLGAIAATRAMLGTGVGLLLSSRIREGRRRKLGWALLAVGVASTIPLAVAVFRRG
jgi:hypothetical protein